MMRIKKNEDEAFCAEIIKALKENDGYCPCVLFKDTDTKCMCKDFRDKVANGYRGECHCGLYVAVEV